MSKSNEVLIAEMQKDIEQIKGDVGELKDSLKIFIEKSEDRFASKWVETALKTFIGSVMVAVIGALLALIIK